MKLYELLAPGGQLIIVDFDKNEQISHPKVHNGFTQEELNDRLKKLALSLLLVILFIVEKSYS